MQFQSVAIHVDIGGRAAECLPTRDSLMQWLGRLIWEREIDGAPHEMELWRMKARVWLRDIPSVACMLQGVGDLFEIVATHDKDAAKSVHLVVIGKQLDKESLQRSLEKLYTT